MSNTFAFFQASRRTVPPQIGRTTLHQAAEISDAINCIYVVISHTYQAAGHEVPQRFDLLNAFRGDKLTLAQAGRILTLWKRWTHQFHGEQVPDLLAVEGFLYALRRNS